MKTYKLDPKKFPKVRRNIILSYIFLAMLGLVVFYLYLRDALFNQAWGLIPFVLLMFVGAGWLAVRDRRRFWEEFQLIFKEDVLIRRAPKSPEMVFKKSDVTGIREVRQGLIVSTKAKENSLLISHYLPDEDYQAVKEILDNWCRGGD